jgi:hypothetical protein
MVYGRLSSYRASYPSSLCRLTVADGRGRYLNYIEFTFYHDAHSITQLKWHTDCKLDTLTHLRRFLNIDAWDDNRRRAGWCQTRAYLLALPLAWYYCTI